MWRSAIVEQVVTSKVFGELTVALRLFPQHFREWVFLGDQIVPHQKVRQYPSSFARFFKPLRTCASFPASKTSFAVREGLASLVVPRKRILRR